MFTSSRQHFIAAALAIVVLAVANRHWVTVSFDPFSTTDPVLSFSIPLFVLFFITLAVGVVIGGVAAWLRQGRWRRLAREEHVEADRLRREVEARRTPPAQPALPATR